MSHAFVLSEEMQWKKGLRFIMFILWHWNVTPYRTTNRDRLFEWLRIRIQIRDWLRIGAPRIVNLDSYHASVYAFSILHHLYGIRNIHVAFSRHIFLDAFLGNRFWIRIIILSHSIVQSLETCLMHQIVVLSFDVLIKPSSGR